MPSAEGGETVAILFMGEIEVEISFSTESLGLVSAQFPDRNQLNNAHSITIEFSHILTINLIPL